MNGAVEWSAVRGFNYHPGYSANLQLTWTHFDPSAWEREVPWALRFGANTLRVWLDWGAYLALGDGLLDRVDAALAVLARHGKPLLAVETCVGSFDDAERGALARDSIATLERHGIGWLAWQLSAGAFVTGSRERTDSFGVRPGEGYMPFVLADGRTRPGHAWLEGRGGRTTPFSATPHPSPLPGGEGDGLASEAMSNAT